MLEDEDITWRSANSVSESIAVILSHENSSPNGDYNTSETYTVLAADGGFLRKTLSAQFEVGTADVSRGNDLLIQPNAVTQFHLNSCSFGGSRAKLGEIIDVTQEIQELKENSSPSDYDLIYTVRFSTGIEMKFLKPIRRDSELSVRKISQGSFSLDEYRVKAFDSSAMNSSNP